MWALSANRCAKKSNSVMMVAFLIGNLCSLCLCTTLLVRRVFETQDPHLNTRHGALLGRTSNKCHPTTKPNTLDINTDEKI